MESVGKKRSRPRRAFTPEFKAEIVELCRRGDRTIAQVVADFDLVDSAVRRWIALADAATNATANAATNPGNGAGGAGRGGSGGLGESERAELAALRAENRRLREDNEILKRATAFFARETR